MSMSFSSRHVPSYRMMSNTQKTLSTTKANSKPISAWNSYLTDDNYKISEEELLKKKKMHMSKHNILHDVDKEARRTMKKKVVKKQSTPAKKMLLLDDESMISELEAHDQHIDAIDMIGDEAGEEESHSQNRSRHGSYNQENRRPTFCSTVNSKPNNTSRVVGLAGASTIKSSSYFNHYTNMSGTGSKSPVPARGNITPVACRTDDDSVSSCAHVFSNATTLTVTHGLEGSAPPAMDEDLEDILAQMELLTAEMKYYEELSGRKNIFNFDEMKEELANDLRSGSVGDGTGDNQDSLASQFIQVLPSGKRTLNQKKLMRYLVNLVCKSMTYLLQNEVKLQAQVAQYSGLERKVDELTAQVNAKPATFLELTPALSNSGAGTSAGYRRSADPTDQRDNSSQAEDEDYSRMCSVYDNYDTSTNVSTNMTSSSSRESLMRTPDLSVTPSAPPPPPPLPPAFNTPVTHSRAQAQTQAQTALSGKSKIQMFAPRVSTVNTLNSNSTRSTAPSTATTPTPSKGNALARSKAQPPIFIPQASSLSADISTPTMKYSQDEETTAADSAAPLVYVPTNTRATDSTPLRMPGTSTTDWLFASSPSSTTNSASSGAAPVWTSKSSTPSDFVSSMELNKTVDIYNHHLPDADATVSSDDELDEHADRLSYHPTKPVFMTSADSVADPAPNAPMNVKAVQFASSNNVSAYVC